MGNTSEITNPTIYAIAGIPGAGKTTFRDKAVIAGLLPKAAFIYDCDLVMEQLPQYQADLQKFGSVAAFQTWELPARDIALQQLQQHMSLGQDIIYDRSCALPDSYAFIKDAIAHSNYKLVFYFVHVNLDTATARVLARQTEQLRHLPLEEIALRAKMLHQLWPAYLDLAHAAFVVDNHAPQHEIIATIAQRQLTIHDFKKYAQFNSAIST